MATKISKTLQKLTPISEEGDKKVYSGDEILLTDKLNDQEREVLLIQIYPLVGLTEISELMGKLESNDVEVSSEGVKLVPNSNAPAPEGGRKKKLRLKKKTRRAKRNRRTMKRRQLH